MQRDIVENLSILKCARYGEKIGRPKNADARPVKIPHFYAGRNQSTGVICVSIFVLKVFDE